MREEERERFVAMRDENEDPVVFDAVFVVLLKGFKIYEESSVRSLPELLTQDCRLEMVLLLPILMICLLFVIPLLPISSY